MVLCDKSEAWLGDGVIVFLSRAGLQCEWMIKRGCRESPNISLSDFSLCRLKTCSGAAPRASQLKSFSSC